MDKLATSPTLPPDSAPRRLAATLIVTYETTRGPRTILTRRPASLRRHPGQISFPGGMVEELDRSPLAAAIREAREEVALRLPADPVAVPLAPVVTLSSGIDILPFWVRLLASPRLRAAPGEVERIIRVPLRGLLDPGVRRPIPHPGRPSEQTMAYVWREQVIWGATARMLDGLLRVYPGLLGGNSQATQSNAQPGPAGERPIPSPADVCCKLIDQE